MIKFSIIIFSNDQRNDAGPPIEWMMTMPLPILLLGVVFKEEPRIPPIGTHTVDDILSQLSVHPNGSLVVPVVLIQAPEYEIIDGYPYGASPVIVSLLRINLIQIIPSRSTHLCY